MWVSEGVKSGTPALSGATSDLCENLNLHASGLPFNL